MIYRPNVSALLGLLAVVLPGAWPPVAGGAEDLVQTVSELVLNQDKDVRSVGLEQVCEGVKGAEATRRFAALLPKLAPEAQVGLLGALAERRDSAAKAAVIEMLASPQAEVRSAAILALGVLGDQADVPRLVALLADAGSEKDAAAAIPRLRGEGVNATLVAATKNAPPEVRVKAFALLVARYAIECVPSLLEAARDADARVRAAAFAALGQLAAAQHVADLAKLVLAAPDATAREQAEKAIMLASQRIPEAEQQAEPLLAAMDSLEAGDKTALLPTLGRVGGARALAVVEAAMNDADAQRRAAGLRALCNWPDGTVAPKLLAIARSAADEADREAALNALVRVAPLPDKRPDAQRLEMLQQAMLLSTHDRQKALILQRARAIRSLAALRFVAPYIDQPKFAQAACETVVELAHHKELRQPNKAEFHKVLDQVIATSKNRTLVERAKRYQEDLTWTEKPTGAAPK